MLRTLAWLATALALCYAQATSAADADASLSIRVPANENPERGAALKCSAYFSVLFMLRERMEIAPEDANLAHLLEKLTEGSVSGFRMAAAMWAAYPEASDNSSRLEQTEGALLYETLSEFKGFADAYVTKALSVAEPARWSEAPVRYLFERFARSEMDLWQLHRTNPAVFEPFETDIRACVFLMEPLAEFLNSVWTQVDQGALDLEPFEGAQ